MSNALDDNDGPVTTEPIQDLYLQMLIRLLETDETNGSSASITLVTNGGVVYGHLVTRGAWKALWAEQMQSASGTNVDAYRTFPDDIDSVIDSIRDEAGQEGAVGNGMRRFVHLRAATLIAPDGTRINLPTWRGRLDSVAGWALGIPSAA